jgi:hypothetical protein
MIFWTLCRWFLMPQIILMCYNDCPPLNGTIDDKIFYEWAISIHHSLKRKHPNLNPLDQLRRSYDHHFPYWILLFLIFYNCIFGYQNTNGG